MDDPPAIDDIHDDRPLAVRRQRRTPKPIVVEGTTAALPAAAMTSNNNSAEELISHQNTSITPSASPQKKRVRFSTSAAGVLPASSTGLTPSLKRHRLISSPGRRTPKSARRASCPVVTRPLSPPPPPRSAGIIQFEPLRQIIDGRVKRRLRRNHLSEEFNKITKEKRLEKQICETSVAALRDELEEKDRRVLQLKRQLYEVKRQSMQGPVLLSAGPNISFDSWTRLENAESFQDASQRGGQQDAQHDETATVLEASNESSETEQDEGLVGTTKEMSMVEDSFVAEQSLARPITTMPPVDGQSMLDSSVQVGVDETQNNTLREQVETLQQSLEQATSELEMTRSTHDRLSSKLRSHLQDASFSGTETDMDTALNKVLTTLVLAQARAEDAEEALAILSSEIAAMGFDGRNAEEMLDAIRRQFRQAHLELEYLDTGETVGAFDHQKLLGVLVERVRTLMEKLRDGEEERDTQHRVRTVLQQRLEKAAAETKTAKDKARELQVEVDEKERSIWNLQRALEGYRTEVKSLEDLVNRLEREHMEATKGLRNTMDEAVADLEEKLEREIKSKEDVLLEAQDDKQLQEELQEKANKAMTVIDRLNREKHELIVTKDSIIAFIDSEARDREVTDAAALAECRSERDAIGQERAELATTLDEVQASVNALTEAKTVLEARLAVEMENGVQVMEKMQSEMTKCLARVNELKSGYANSKDGAASTVLPATPCSLRFGSPTKKRRKYDSGIGVIEETDEMMMDAEPTEG